jgi:hypothetical protein
VAAGVDAERAATAAALLSLLTLADLTATNGSFSTETNLASAFGKWILKNLSTSSFITPITLITFENYQIL